MQRRDFITQGLLTVPVLSGTLPELRTGLRVLFVTDLHLSPDIEVSVRSAAFLRDYVNTHAIDFVINGGDAVYDVAKLRSTEGGKLWDLATDVFASFNKPVYHCIGNHDIYEWELHEQLDHAQQFKEAVVQRLLMPGRYYAFQKSNWKFIILDSMMHRPRGYRGELDETQMQWFSTELVKDPQLHTCIISHIPIITACQALYLSWERHALAPLVAERLSHFDAARIFEATQQTKVSLYLHGHLHMRESIQYSNSTIQTHAAFCGDMWKGPFHGFRPGFTMLELERDGRVSTEYINLPTV